MTFSEEVNGALARAHRHGSSVTLLSGLVLRNSALSSALGDRGGQRRRGRRRDLCPLLGGAAGDALDRGAPRLRVSDVVRALAKVPEVEAARRLRASGIDAEQLRYIADELDAR